jgi:hypothetical protein
MSIRTAEPFASDEGELTPEPNTLRALALGVAGASTFGLAVAVGHGPLAMLHGAWMAPVLFAGGALLATPPLYLAVTHVGAQTPAERVFRDVARVLGETGTVLLGLAAPAAYFSATLRTATAYGLLAATLAVVGFVAVRVVARRFFAHTTGASLAWTVLAVALGLRLMTTLGHQL